jgi:glycosyltransferase involved in cell wall biosynthesis
LSELLTVSILLPIRNEESSIAAALLAIQGQDYPTERVEIIIADGMSSDNTRQIICRQFGEQNLKIIDNPGKIVPTGLNAALQIARGEIIIRVDGHTLIAPDYVRRSVETLARTGADNVGGRMNARGQSRFGEAVAVATSTPFGVGGARFHYSDQEEWVDTVYMGAWRREVFEKIGLFDEELIRDQDDEFNYRLREYGGKILLSPKIKSVYTNRSSPRALWKQYFQYGFWKVRVLQKHPRQMSFRQFVPPLFVAALAINLILALFTAWGWITLLLVGGSYFFANMAASLITAKKIGWHHLVLLPGTFAILHLSYGLGFLAGLIKFWNRWGDKIGKVPNWVSAHD